MIIKVGYYDWHEFGLKDSFYPDDMPPEWRLTFYANEMECTQIDISALKDIDELFDDLPERFDIVIHAQDNQQWPVLQQLLESNELNIKAIVCTKQCQQQWAEALARYAVPCFSNRDERVFNNELNVKALQVSITELNILYVDEALKLKQWRQLIEEWVAQSKAQQGYLMLNAKSIKSSVASELRIMMDMMAY